MDFAFRQGYLPATGGVLWLPLLGYFRAVMDVPPLQRRLRFTARTSDFNELASGAPHLNVKCDEFSQSVVLSFDGSASAAAFPAVRIWNPYLRPGEFWNEYVADDTMPGRLLLTLTGTSGCSAVLR